jgi:hypothetical protein
MALPYRALGETFLIPSFVETRIGQGIENVDPDSENGSNQCRGSVANYGSATFDPAAGGNVEYLSRDVAGDRWECLVDLWTIEEGRSDLVLEVPVSESRSREFLTNLGRV